MLSHYHESAKREKERERERDGRGIERAEEVFVIPVCVYLCLSLHETNKWVKSDEVKKSVTSLNSSFFARIIDASKFSATLPRRPSLCQLKLISEFLLSRTSNTINFTPAYLQLIERGTSLKNDCNTKPPD